MFVELRELLRSGAIRRHQLGSKYLFTATSYYKIYSCSLACNRRENNTFLQEGS